MGRSWLEFQRTLQVAAEVVVLSLSLSLSLSVLQQKQGLPTGASREAPVDNACLSAILLCYLGYAIYTLLPLLSILRGQCFFFFFGVIASSLESLLASLESLLHF